MDQTRRSLPEYGICWGISRLLAVFQWLCNCGPSAAASGFGPISHSSIPPYACGQLVDTPLRTYVKKLTESAHEGHYFLGYWGQASGSELRRYRGNP